jgi:hypothetical protein
MYLTTLCSLPTAPNDLHFLFAYSRFSSSVTSAVAGHSTRQVWGQTRLDSSGGTRNSLVSYLTRRSCAVIVSLATRRARGKLTRQCSQVHLKKATFPEREIDIYMLLSRMTSLAAHLSTSKHHGAQHHDRPCTECDAQANSKCMQVQYT